MSVTDRLVVEKLRAALGACCIGREIIVLEETKSTNDRVLELALEGAKEGVVVFAERQTAGRGQHGNRWESAAGHGLWFSMLLRPRIPLRDSVRLTTWLAQAVAATITQTTGLEATVKLPNDIYIAEQKIAGVLVEMRAMPQADHAAIAGIGVNVNQTAEDFSPKIRDRAGSLRLALGQPVERHDLAIALLKNLDATYRETFAP